MYNRKENDKVSNTAIIRCVMYKGLMQEYQKKCTKTSTGAKKYFVPRTEEDIIFRDSKPIKSWEMPEKICVVRPSKNYS